MQRRAAKRRDDGGKAAEQSMGRADYETNRIHDPNYFRILDTTLRDGEQAPGASLIAEEKLIIACQLAKLRLDIMEVGFLSSSNKEAEAVRRITYKVGNAVGEDGYIPVICAAIRCHEGDIKAAWNAVNPTLKFKLAKEMAKVPGCSTRWTSSRKQRWLPPLRGFIKWLLEDFEWDEDMRSIAEDIQKLLNTHVHWTLTFVDREANTLPYKLASVANSSNIGLTYFDSPPNVRDLLLDDRG
ncbi:hypothetical protein Tsubulata_041222 [Turnera subulata]|uniref:methylthioalkylmalate synthase n=1 Tax=Turnera subulata TaxID=218843 RepID=A0A9Q0FTU4_9ROSI|nr:hypothetical protein Tsubulata_041222 [Turnera subulata]